MKKTIKEFVNIVYHNIFYYKSKKDKNIQIIQLSKLTKIHIIPREKF